jgi:hypothetical protein
MDQDDAIGRLAQQIDATRKSEQIARDADRTAALRREGASELHRICAEFVAAVNGRLPEAVLDLSPPAYSPETFREAGVNLIQIGSQGREIQIAFQAPTQLVSTEKFLVPYVLEGELRAYNQEMLERFTIQSYLIFFCVENETASWRFYDWKTLRTGPIDSGLLVSLLETLF